VIDIVEGVLRTADLIPAGTDSIAAPYSVYNIGNNKPEELMEMIHLLEQSLGQTAEKNMLPMQPGDVPETYAEIEALSRDTGFRPETPLALGISRFVEWYRDFYDA